MKDIQLLGVALLILGILVVAGYGLYHFAMEEEIPLFMRAGVMAVILGIAVILASLVRERLMDLKKENQYKSDNHEPSRKILRKPRRLRRLSRKRK